MTDSNLEAVTEIVRDLFDEYTGPVTRELNAKMVPQWDSIAHVQLIAYVEKIFAVRFTAGEVNKFANLGDMLDAVDRKRKG